MNFTHKNADLLYATKVWLLSVVLSPIMLLLIPGLGPFSNFNSIFKSLYEVIMAYFTFAMLSLIFSVPSWLVFMLVVRFIVRGPDRAYDKKTLIQIAAIIIGLAPFVLLGGIDDFSAEFLFFSLPYLITLSFGIWWFKLKTVHEEKEKDMLDHLIE